MLFAKIFGIISFIVATLLAAFYFTGSITNEIVMSFGFTISMLVGVYMFAVFPALLSEAVGSERAKR